MCLKLRQAVKNLPLLLLVIILALPMVAIFGAWLPLNASEVHTSVENTANQDAWSILYEMTQTVLPDYTWTTFVLAIGVAIGVGSVGIGAALIVTLYDFHFRRWIAWALVLPLAMPAYVVAYAYTDFLQFSGPLQTFLRQTLHVQGRVFPEIRSLWGAIWVFTFSFYPYVYLLVRTALSERAAHLTEVARTLGVPWFSRLWFVILPLTRPAAAAGVVLVLMETLADYGVSSYFGVQTYTAGIYKAWLAMDNRLAAAQLSSILLVVVLFLLMYEHKAQQKMRFSTRTSAKVDAQIKKVRGSFAIILTALGLIPVFAGFVLPVVFMLKPLGNEWSNLPWQHFLQWTFNSVRLAAISSVVVTVIALWLAHSARGYSSQLLTLVTRLVNIGYAVPGAVIVVGLLLPVGWLQVKMPFLNIVFWISVTILGLIWAYSVRFSAVAFQNIQSGYARLSPSLDESAKMLGCGSTQLLGYVHLPLLKKSIFVALLMVFVDVMKELPATLVLRPFNSDTLAVVAYQLARDERLGEAALPSLMLVLVGLIPVIFLSKTLSEHENTIAS